MTVRRQLLNYGKERTDFRVGSGAFEELPRMLSGTVAKTVRAELVIEPDADAACGQTVRRALVDAGFSVDEFPLASDGEATIGRAQELFDSLGRDGITAEDIVVAVGGSSVCGLVTFCAGSWCGGTPFVLVPTTLDAMVTAATVMRPLTVGDGAPLVSSKVHATLVVCELDLVLGKPVEELGLGLVEILAAYLAESRKYWERIDEVVAGLSGGTAGALMTAVSESQTSRANALKSTSPSARQALEYGWTTAGALRACLGPEVPEYLLLAEGMRFEARLATEASTFPVDDVFKQDDCLEELGVEELPFELDAETFVASLKAERFRRANRFMLPLPKRAGFIRLTSVDDEVLMRHAEAYLDSRAELVEEEA